MKKWLVPRQSCGDEHPVSVGDARLFGLNAAQGSRSHSYDKRAADQTGRVGAPTESGDRQRRVGRVLVGIVICVGLLATPVLASALNYGHGTYGTCQYSSCSLTLTSDGLVSIDVIPTGGGSCTINVDNVSVQTYSSTGYSLSVTGSTTNTSLLSPTSFITASTGTPAVPVALANDTWGFRVDGASSFGPGPTSAQSNGSQPSVTFAGMPASNQTPAVLATTSAAANPAVVTKVWYGVCADTAVTSGTYTTQVTYTAIVN